MYSHENCAEIITFYICDFRENRRRESRTVLIAVHDIT
jgi:hypothetical protein